MPRKEMSMVDTASLVLAGAAGAAAAGGLSYAVFYRRPRARAAMLARAGAAEVVVSAIGLERSKREMRALMVERDLLS
jgi:hypothetical protein